MTEKVSYPREKIKILLLEGIHSAAATRFKSAGYNVETRKESLSESELIKIIPSVHLLGIRSKTEITPRVLKKASSLLSIGCFCIGTDQVALKEAAGEGVPVFNAPFSNTRSVAELTIALMIMLSRRAAHKSQLLHRGIWDKSADGCFEVRGKTLGIVGYGHIGPQVGILAEALGMKVLYFDIATKLPLGNAQAVSSLEDVLTASDCVTLHVPETKRTANMISKRELALMKKGANFINLSRGKVVDIQELSKALKKGYIGGAAIDVFPKEPHSNKEKFSSPLQGLENVILTPHIGGSTLEAQKNIGLEVTASLLKFLEAGATSGSVNFPQVELPIASGCHRILNIHKNVPGVLSSITSIIAKIGVNIHSQVLSTEGEVGYLIMDVEESLSKAAKEKIAELPASIKTRLVF